MVQKELGDGWSLFSELCNCFSVNFQVPADEFSHFNNYTCLFPVLQKSGLPWVEPKKTLTLDFDDLKDAVTSGFGVS